MRHLVCICLLAGVLSAQPDGRGVEVISRQVEAFEREPRVALIVGIDQYPKASGFRKLDYATKDAGEVAQALSGPGLAYKVRVLLDHEGLHHEIRQALKDAAAAVNGKGTLLFFFAGHGGQKDRKQYLATYEAGADRLDEFGLPLSEIEEILNSSAAPRKMMFIDACRDEAKAPGESRGSDSLATFSRLDESEGLRILNAAAPFRVSYEDAKLQHGIFTYFLLKGLRGEAADAYGLVTFHGLAGYVSREVRDYTYPQGRLQSPYEAGDAFGDFLLGGKLQQHPSPAVESGAAAADPIHAALERARGSHDPKILDAFIFLFPNSPYANLARVERAAMDASPSQALFAQALNLFDNGETPLALSAFEAALRADAANLDAAAYQALLLEFDQAYPEAIQVANSVLAKQPDHVVALLARGDAFSHSGRADSANADLGRVRNSTATDARGYFLRAIAAQHGEPDEAALAPLNEAIRLRPDYPRALNGRCLTYRHLAQYDKAIQDCDAALRLQPNYAVALVNRGEVYSAEKDFIRAIRDYDACLRLWPDDADALNSRGKAFLSLQKFDRAIADFTAAVRFRPFYALPYNGRGLAWLKQQKYDRALSDFTEAIRCDPSVPDYYSNRALARDGLGDKKGAAADRAKASELRSKAHP